MHIVFPVLLASFALRALALNYNAVNLASTVLTGPLLRPRSHVLQAPSRLSSIKEISTGLKQKEEPAFSVSALLCTLDLTT